MPLAEIRLLEGRTKEEKERILTAVTGALRESTGAPLEKIRVWIQEMPRDHYMVAGRLASGS
jgi:4-oxalocrotonate tautomerase